MFKQMDERQLTEDEHSIIQKRVRNGSLVRCLFIPRPTKLAHTQSAQIELQRKMFAEFERRDKQRKVRHRSQDLQRSCSLTLKSIYCPQTLLKLLTFSGAPTLYACLPKPGR